MSFFSDIFVSSTATTTMASITSTDVASMVSTIAEVEAISEVVSGVAPAVGLLPARDLCVGVAQVVRDTMKSLMGSMAQPCPSVSEVVTTSSIPDSFSPANILTVVTVLGSANEALKAAYRALDSWERSKSFDYKG